MFRIAVHQHLIKHLTHLTFGKGAAYLLNKLVKYRSIVLVGDINEGQLTVSNHELRLRDILIVISNAFTAPIRNAHNTSSLIEVIAITNYVTSLSCVLHHTHSHSNDKFGTYAYIKGSF